jgi:hypothetical protein
MGKDVGRTMRRDELKALGIERIEVDPLVVVEHLRIFVDVFIRSDSRVRAASLLKREGFSDRFASCVMERMDANLCRLDNHQSRPVRWPRQFLKQGILIDSGGAFAMGMEQASAASIARSRHALFSIDAGRLAVFFEHEWGVWYCSAPNQPMQADERRSGARG